MTNESLCKSLEDQKVLAIIPARQGSKRLPNKNALPFMGVPLLVWVANECRKSKYINRIVVSTESEIISQVCLNHDIEVIKRPSELATDEAVKQDVIVHATRHLTDTENYTPDIVLSLQANSPEMTSLDLDKAIDFFHRKLYPGYAVKEVISVSPGTMVQNAAFRIMTYKTVFQKTLSTYVGVYLCDYLDVHTKDDLDECEKRIRSRLKQK